MIQNSIATLQPNKKKQPKSIENNLNELSSLPNADGDNLPPKENFFNKSHSTDIEFQEYRQITKLYKNLSLAQKKKFISSFIYTFDEKSLRKFNSSLESFRHKDFKYIITEKLPGLNDTNELNIVSNKKQVKRKPRPKKKLRPVVKTVSLTTVRSNLTNKRSKTNSSIGNQRRNALIRRSSVISLYHQKLNPETGVFFNFYNLDIDRFFSSKDS